MSLLDEPVASIAVGKLAADAMVPQSTPKRDQQREKISYVKMVEVRPSPLNPREQYDAEQIQALADSIAADGLLSPIVVREILSIPAQGDAAPLARYEIIAGERRYRAMVLLDWQTAPVIIREGITDDDLVRIAIIENLRRVNLDPIEEAGGYSRLRDMGHEVKEIAVMVGRSQPAISNAMRLLRLPDSIKDDIRAGNLSMSHGVSLASLGDYPDDMLRLAHSAIENRWASKHLENVVQLTIAQNNREKNPALFDTEPSERVVSAESVPVAEESSELAPVDLPAAPITPPATVPEPSGDEDVERDVDDSDAEFESVATAPVEAPTVVEAPAPTTTAAPATPAASTVAAVNRLTKPATTPPAATVTPAPEKRLPASTPAPVTSATPVATAESASGFVNVMLPQSDYDWLMANRVKPKEVVGLARRFRELVAPEVEQMLVQLTAHLNKARADSGMNMEISPADQLEALVRKRFDALGITAPAIIPTEPTAPSVAPVEASVEATAEVEGTEPTAVLDAAAPTLDITSDDEPDMTDPFAEEE